MKRFIRCPSFCCSKLLCRYVQLSLLDLIIDGVGQSTYPDGRRRVYRDGVVPWRTVCVRGRRPDAQAGESVSGKHSSQCRCGMSCGRPDVALLVVTANACCRPRFSIQAPFSRSKTARSPSCCVPMRVGMVIVRISRDVLTRSVVRHNGVQTVLQHLDPWQCGFV